MGVLSATCHFLVVAAFRYAEAAVLAPLIYLELVTAVVLGWLIFSEWPDLLAFVGIALILLGGLAIVATERRRPVP